MDKFYFTVYSDNNPVPYKRTTSRQKFVDEGYHRYLDYKELVRLAFYQAFGAWPENLLPVKQKYYLNITIFFKDGHHADCTNVLKGIEDAIFEKPLNDKYIVSRVKDYYFDKNNPRVEIELLKARK